MKRTKRQRIVAITARIRKARTELSQAEEELEALLAEEDQPDPGPDFTRIAAQVAGAMSSAAAAGKMPTREGLLEWAQSPAIRQAISAIGFEHATKLRGPKQKPSIAARVLAVLLEEPTREFNAATVARRAGCSEAVARTNLNRLATEGQALRIRPGVFRASA
jgi:hypothetical protein